MVDFNVNRKAFNIYSREDFINILYLIDNIVIGLKSLEYYKNSIENSIENSIFSDIDKDITYLEELRKMFFSLLSRKDEEIILNDLELGLLSEVFYIEYKYKEVVSKIWESSLTPIDSINEKDNYSLLVKYIRDEIPLSEVINSLNDKEKLFISTSYTTPKSIENINGSYGNYGLVYSCNFSNFLGACENDCHSMLLPRDGYFVLLKGEKENVTYRIGYISVLGKELYSYQPTLTKTPRNLTNITEINNVGLFTVHNEVILRDSKPIAVVQFYYDRRFMCIESENVKEISKMFNIPVRYISRTSDLTMEEFVNNPYRDAIAMIIEKLLNNPDWDNPILRKSNSEYYQLYREFLEVENIEQITRK